MLWGRLQLSGVTFEDHPITKALACGVPVVSTAVGIAPKAIRDGQTGFLLKTRDPERMASRMTQAIALGPSAGLDCVSVARVCALTSRQTCRVIAGMVVQLLKDPEKRREMGAKNRQRFVELYTLDSFARNLGTAFNRVLGISSSTPSRAPQTDAA
jgi:glycosyltransferase involved in cell wall biosynthesis